MSAPARVAEPALLKVPRLLRYEPIITVLAKFALPFTSRVYRAALHDTAIDEV